MKQALLVMVDGDISEYEAKQRVLKAFNGLPLQIRQFGYDPSHPEEVTYHSGKWFKFLGNGEQVESSAGDLSQPAESFRKIIWKEMKPFLRELWYGPKKEEAAASASQ